MNKEKLAELISEALPKDRHGEVVVDYGVGNFPVYAAPDVLAERIAEHIFSVTSDTNN